MPFVDGCQLARWGRPSELKLVTIPDLQFAILHAVSDNRFKCLDITSTREKVGYQPQDDAFKRFQSGIHYRERWYTEGEGHRA